MEEPGMGRNGLLRRAGLLILLLAARAVPAQTDGGELGLRVETGAEPPRTGLVWTLRIDADHPLPGEVEASRPELPPELDFRGMRVSSRTEGGTRRTRIEYDLLPLRPGAAVIPPITVGAAGRRGRTGAINLVIGGGEDGALPPERPPMPELSWGRPSAPPRAGEPFEIGLFRADGGAAPPSGEFRPAPPKNAIVEALPAGEGALLRLLVLPLGGGLLELEPFTLRLDGLTLESPPLSLPLLPAPPKAPSPSGPPPEPGGESLSEAETPAPFRAASLTGEAPAGGAVRRAHDAARTKAAAGETAEALALLRAAERDLLLGPRLRPVRRELERELGLGRAGDEPWLPRSLFVAGGGGGILLALALLLSGKKTGPRTPRPRPRRGIILLAGILVLCCFRGFTRSGGGDHAVLRGTAASRAPAPGSTAACAFREGERVRLRAGAGGWLYVEAEPEAGDGAGDPARSGWIPRERAILY